MRTSRASTPPAAVPAGSGLPFTDRVIPVVAIDRPQHAAPLGRALIDGGTGVVEVTFRTPAAAESVRILADSTDLAVGAGTVLDRAQVDQAVEAGARFIVSPGLDSDVVSYCQDLEIPVLPGIVTASEVQAAIALGLSTVKFFPAEQAGGAALVRALAAPFPEVRFVPTGGITIDTLPIYLAEPSVVAVGGSWVATPEHLAAEDWRGITQRIRAAIDLAEPRTAPVVEQEG